MFNICKVINIAGVLDCSSAQGAKVLKPTKDEKRAISALKKVAAKWPKSLWLFSASGSLCVMRSGPNGDQIVNSGGGIDQAYLIVSVNIPNDGGDW